MPHYCLTIVRPDKISGILYRVLSRNEVCSSEKLAESLCVDSLSSLFAFFTFLAACVPAIRATGCTTQAPTARARACLSLRVFWHASLGLILRDGIIVIGKPCLLSDDARLASFWHLVISPAEVSLLLSAEGELFRACSPGNLFSYP